MELYGKATQDWTRSAGSDSDGGLHILICDDEPDDAEKIRSLTASMLPKDRKHTDLQVYTEPSMIPSSLLSACDLALLDIDLQIDGFTGMDLARKLRRLRPEAVIIFITNFIEYAPEGYEVQAFRYILKRDLEKGLQNYLPQAFQKLNRIRKTLRIQIDGEIIELKINAIVYLEVRQHETTIYVTSQGQLVPYCVRSSLTELECQLEPYGFLRIHKSYLVNMKCIQKFQIRGVHLYNGVDLRVSELNYAENKRKFLLWKGCV